MHGHAVLVEGEEDRFGLDVRDPQAHEVWHAFDGVTEPLDVGHRAERFGREPLGQRPSLLGLALEAPSEELGGGGAVADECRDVLDAAAPGAFLRASHDERGEAEPPPHEERRRALRTAQLVRRHRAQIGAEVVERDRNVAGRRARVDVHRHAAVTRAGDDGRRRLQGADLVVGELHGHERGVGANRVEHRVGDRTDRAGRHRRR